VGALLQLGNISKETEIAVVGAGIAGLTAFVALSLMGAKVTLYEKEAAVLTLQSGTTHRYIHPSVNFWPDEDANRTTDFPFFDWYSSICSTVISTFLLQWEGDPMANPHRRDPLQDPVLKDSTERDPVFDCELKFSRYDKVTKKVHLIDNRPNRNVKRVEADLVLVAIGFGVEDDLEDTSQRPYWDKDLINYYYTSGGHNIIVSGAGDGGLMDCLRLVYQGFKSGDLALDLIRALETGQYAVRDNIKKIEAEALAEPDPNIRAQRLQDEYYKMFEDGGSLNKSARQLLDAALVRPTSQKRPNQISLVGQFAAPFELGAAPINRLMFAYALKAGAVAFVRGKITRPGDTFLLDEGGGAHPVEKDAIVIVRHGPKHALSGFLGKNQCKELRKAQQTPGAFANGKGQFDNEFFLEGSLYPSRKADPEIFAATRHKVAHRFVYERHNGILELSVENPLSPQFFLKGTAAVPGGTPDRLGSVPDSLFGIPVKKRGGSSSLATSALGVVE
jgi:hypothetical protein